MGEAVLKPRKADGLDVPAGLLVPFRLGDALKLQTEGDVVEDRPPGEERVLLKYHPPLGPRPLDGDAVQGHLAAGGPLKAGHDPQEGRLAAAGGAEDADELLLPHREVDLAERLEGLALHREALRQALDLQERGHSGGDLVGGSIRLFCRERVRAAIGK